MDASEICKESEFCFRFLFDLKIHCFFFISNHRRDDFCFRRRKPPNVQTRETFIQTAITCKPFSCYELKRVDDETSDKSIERNHRRDENPAKNPFSSKLKENNEIKSTQRNTDKNNGGHRNQTRHQDEHNSLRGKHTNQRSKDDERRSRDEQLSVDRSKRKRSRSLSKDRKRARRSRSRSRSRPRRERERNAHERDSPVRTSRNQVKFFLISNKVAFSIYESKIDIFLIIFSAVE